MSEIEKKKERRNEILKLIRKGKPKFESIEFTKLAGKFIMERRKELKISPFDMAKSLNIAYRTYNRYENGSANIPMHTLLLICYFLDISMDTLTSKYYEEVYGYFFKDDFKKNIYQDLHIEIPLYSKQELKESIDTIKYIFSNANDKQIISTLKVILNLFKSKINADMI